MESTMVPPKQIQSARKVNALQSHPLVAYFLLAYLITWSFSIFAARGLLPFSVPIWIETTGVFLYHFGPSVAGIIMAAVEGGRTGVKALLRSLGHVRVGVGWYMFAIFYPIVLRLAATGLVYTLGGPAPSFFANASQGLPPGNPLLYAPLMFIGSLILAGLAEEIGWRGYALPKLQSRYGGLAASLIMAALWAAWHYHPFAFRLLSVTIPWHILSVLGMTILLTWVYNSTGGSLWMVVLFHSCSNFADWVVLTNPAYGGSLPAYSAYILMNLAVALLIAIAYRKRDLGCLPGKSKP